MKINYLLFLFFACSVASFSQTSETEIIKSFKQGGAGNCASISVIKLAIAHYGIDHVFFNVEHKNNNYHILMRDSVIVDLSDTDLQTMESLNYFVKKENESIYKYAKFLYAVMAKRRKDTEKFKSIERAATYYKWGWIKTTNHLLEQDTEVNLEYLGLKKSFRKINKADIDQYAKIVITSGKHSAFSTKGSYDEYGDPTPNTDFAKNHANAPINENYNYILKD